MSAFVRLVGIVTGGAKGLGRGIAFHLSAHHHSVMIMDVDEEAGNECLAALPKEQIRFFRGSVAEEADVEKCVTACLKEFGRLDFIVNNAAVAIPSSGPVEKIALDLWNRVLGVNLTGPLLMAKHAAAHLRSTGGAIVNIASTRAFQSEPNSEAYAATKGGLVALTHALAVSLGPQIRVNCISPGWIEVRDWQKSSKKQEVKHSEADKKQHPVGRVGVPADIAELVEFLVTPSKSGFMTGQNIVVDGGISKRMIYTEDE